ncbi:hypothetical protein AWB82_03059 [Caballeronia glebae]|uniref:Uncharacterized protein n=1 Tax=Caballeronia glebae TaxID=1777143 RepID=A0A158AVN0_9BURK|nr:hypothetical protein AWB82_03059 [Caballeronia glebae]
MTSTWLHNLPLWQMTLAVFGATGAAGAAVHFVTGRLAASAYRRSFTALSPGLLSPIGIIFGLLIAFTAAQVWNDTARANNAVDAEAGALRSVVVLSAVFPEDAQTQLRKLVREYIEYTVGTEWPMMARMTVAPVERAGAMRGHVLRYAIEHIGDGAALRIGGNVRPVRREYVVGATPEQQLERLREQTLHVLADGFVGIGNDPAAETEVAACVFGRAAGSLNHAIDADENRNDELAHECSPSRWTRSVHRYDERPGRKSTSAAAFRSGAARFGEAGPADRVASQTR